jgi:hypothetical protein
MIWLFTLPVVEEGIYIGSISSEDIENFDNDKVIDYKYTLAGFTRTDSSSSIKKFSKNHTRTSFLFWQKSYIGYYEIDDMSFSPNWKEQGRILR